jgi:hypothetical protein
LSAAFTNIRSTQAMTNQLRLLTALLSIPLSFQLHAQERLTEVSIKGEHFLINNAPSYQGATWKNPEGKQIPMEGLLMNARLVQGIFDDLNPETRDKWAYKDTGKWDPERNTNEFIEAMKSWRQNGLLAFTINLQGGSPEGYSKKQPWINSAFDPKGNLREAYMNRLARILKRADELGMVALVGYFYFGQDQHLEDEAAVKNAVDQATRWMLNGGWKNVLVEISNECDSNSYNHPILKPERIHGLIEQVKSTTINGRRLLASTSYMGGKLPGKKVVSASDFVLLHGNGVKETDKMVELIKNTRQLIGDDVKPIVNNEDDRPWLDKNQGFREQGNNMIVSIENGVSWGYFDFRRKGESYEQGFQNPPVDWSIRSDRKKQFFELLKKVTAH